MEEKLEGLLDHIVYRVEETGFTVIRLKVAHKKDPVCVVGVIPLAQPGETLCCLGEWKNHPKHGKQFDLKSCTTRAPSDVLGIQKYLESGLIKGIGSAYAKRIVDAFGVHTLEIIDKDPKRLLKVPGIGKKRAKSLLDSWSEQRSVREIMIFLQSHGVSPAYAQKIFKTYGEKSIQKVKENPFELARTVFGIGFKMADSIASNLGISKDSEIRLKAGIEHVLWDLSSLGHVCFPKDQLLEKSSLILEVTDLDVLRKSLDNLEKEKRVVKENDLIWIAPLHFSESGIAKEFSRLLQGQSELRAVDTDKAINWVEQELKIILAPEQKEAISRALKSKFLVITGGPGTGKSTITKAILHISKELTKRIALAAPTGKAAERMSQITHKKALTIHALLELDFQSGTFKHDKNDPLKCDLIIVDEASMVDTQLMYSLLKATPDSARFILIGDVDQLPSVGPGNVLKDIIGSKVVPVIKLTKIFRQARDSKIIVNAHRVNNGTLPNLKNEKDSDFFFIPEKKSEDILKTITELVTERVPQKMKFDPFRDIQVLAPMKKGVIGTDNLNLSLQKALNPCEEKIIFNGIEFRLHDKVMQIRNNYQKLVFNGDIGIISSLNKENHQITVTFHNREIIYEFSEVDELILSYAVSIHKYQGSECPCIIIPIHSSHFKLLSKNLVYTGITRGKKLVILVGAKEALQLAVNNKEAQERHTGLKDFLRKTIWY